MKNARTGKAVPPRRTLTQLAAAAETGALHVEGEPGGIVYLTDGWVSYVESPASPGVGELLTTSGRLPAQVWEGAAASGEAVGQLLVAQGHLTQGELELCTLGAIYDAAFFVLSAAPARIRFEAGERHWLGPVCQVDAAVLGRELTRRRKLLDDVHPVSDVDTGRLLAAPRAPAPRLVVTAPQWELVVHCDGHRTATDLARLLGRAGYTTVLELRRLAAAGLVTAIPQEEAKPDEPAAQPQDKAKPDEPGAHPQDKAKLAAHPHEKAKPDQPGAQPQDESRPGAQPQDKAKPEDAGAHLPVEEAEPDVDAPRAERAVGRAPVAKAAGAKADAPAASAKAGTAARSPARGGRDKGSGAAAAEKGLAPRRASSSRRAVAAAPPASGRPAQTDARLPRRTPGEQMSGPDPPLAFRGEPDEALLTRIRAGLEAL